MGTRIKSLLSSLTISIVEITKNTDNCVTAVFWCLWQICYSSCSSSVPTGIPHISMGAVRSLNRFKVRALASFFRKVIAVWRTVQEFNCKSKKSRYTDSTKSGKAFLLLAQFMLNYVTALYNKASLRALPGVPLAGKPPAKILFQKINRSSVCYSIVMSPKTQ